MTRQQTNLNKIIIVILLIFLSFLILFNNVNAITFENVKVVKNEQEILEDGVIYNYQVINSNYGTNSKLDRKDFFLFLLCHFFNIFDVLICKILKLLFTVFLLILGNFICFLEFLYIVH